MKIKALCAVLVPVAAVGGYLAWPRTVAPPPEKPAAPAAAVEAPAGKVLAVPVEIALALEQKSIVAEFVGNGRDGLRAVIMNKATTPLRVTVPVGQTFDFERNQVVVVRPGEVEVAPGRTCHLVLRTAALRSTNALGEAPYQLSYATTARIAPLLSHVQSRAEVTLGAVQTAILALTENLPLSAVAKFTLASTPLPSRFNTDAFRADTFDIVTALTLLREIGVKDMGIAMTVDPQLKIEAMIDPLSRPIAMRYYGIHPEAEWEFWRTELLNGEPSTRHYALYGIARFYPDVALQMLPRWARETRTNPVYRLAAVQALADTQRSDALSLLRQLSVELGPGTELGKAAMSAGDYLDYRLAQIAEARKSAVAFRTSSTETKQPEL
jgi:hypothetical protein